MTDKGFNIFDECAARCVHLFPQKKSAPLLPDGTVKCIDTSTSIANSQRIQAEINESGTIAKIR